MLKVTAHRFALHRVHVERVARNFRREVLKHGSKPDGGSEVAASARLRRPHPTDEAAASLSGSLWMRAVGRGQGAATTLPDDALRIVMRGADKEDRAAAA
jgi:hypothetical protein